MSGKRIGIFTADGGTGGYGCPSAQKGGAGLKKTQSRLLTDAFREIKKTRSRFFSILVLSALAVAFLAGLRTTAPDMERSADAYFDAQNLMDIQVLSTLGFTGDDVAALRSRPGISAAEGAWTADAIVHLEENDSIVKLHSISEQGINMPRLTSGRLPEGSGECLAEPLFLTEAGLEVGDTISLDTGKDAYKDALRQTTFTIVGTADSPLYIGVQRGSSTLGTGKVSAFLLLPRSSFAMEYYTEIYLTIEGADKRICYSDAYEALIDDSADALKPLGQERAHLRYDDVVGTATRELADAQEKYDEAEAEANQELADAQQELKDARHELDDGWTEYHDGRATLAKETADGQKELDDALADLEQGEIDYTEGQQELADGWTDYNQGLEELADGQEDYDAALPDLESGEAEYNDALRELQDGEAEYADGLREYNDGLAQLEDSAQKLNDAKEELDDAPEQLFEGEQQYAAGKSMYDAQVSQLNALLSPLLPGYTGTSNDDLVDRMNDLTLQAGDWAVIDGTRDGLKLLADAGAATPPQLALYGGLNAAFPDAADIAGYTGLAATLNASRAQLADARNSLDFGHAAYEIGLEQYNEGCREFQDGAAELQESYPELADARAELDDGWAQLREGRRELDDGWAQLDDARRELADGQQELADAYQTLIDGQQELTDARIELDDGWVDYSDGKAELAKETAKAEHKLAGAYAELQDGEAEYTDGLAEYEQGKAEADEELSDARKTLNDARRDLSRIDNCKWYILSRDTNMGYASFQSDAERMGNLASVFPVIFFLVAALVCLTTMTRMVEEQRIQIGGLKALGYRRRAIAVKYVGYGFLSSVIGGLLGLLVGCTVIPYTIYTAWGTLYTLGDLVLPLYPGISVISVAAAMATVTLSALWACFSTLAAVPAQLMRPKAPPAGKRVLLERVSPLWKRLSFVHKVTVRNLFRYKKRFWMTVIGIGGCTALLITGFGLRDSIFDVLNLQYDKISLYSSQIGLVDDVTDDELTEIARTLDTSGQVADWGLFHQDSLSAESAVRTEDVYLITAAGQSELNDFIRLGHRRDGKPVTLDVEGAVITEKLAALLDVAVGDTITLDGDRRVTVPVADITENYIQHYVYLSRDTYTRIYGAEPTGNLILATYTENTTETADRVSSALIPLSGVTAVSRSADTREIFSNNMQSVNYAVIIVTVSAAALAFVVLYNLTNINITERRRELATLKVLGFYDRELSAYVYRENILLTLFGILIGLVMGKYLHQWLVLTVEIDMLMFGRTAHLMSYGCAAGLTAVFTVLVNMAAHRKLKKIDMVESLKTME